MTESPLNPERNPIEILLIDDEASVLFALRLLLEAIGYKVQDFSSPVAALESLKSGSRPALIICDLRMPKLNGIEVLKAVKAENLEIPFVLMSAHAGGEEILKAKELGAFGFLAKPFSPDQLHELVGKISNN